MSTDIYVNGTENVYEYEISTLGTAPRSSQKHGLETLHNILKTSVKFELRIRMEDWDEGKRFAKYWQFDVARPDEDYRLSVTGYSGNTGDSLSGHSGAKFSTKDCDLDTYSINCAQIYKGAWWYKACHSSNLNGVYHEGGAHNPQVACRWR